MRNTMLALLALMPFFLFSQNVRTYDGSGNNLRNSDWGATFTVLPRIAPPIYADNIGVPSDSNIPAPREISNGLSDQHIMYHDTLRNLSDFLPAFGQFIDHDIIFTANGSDVYCTDIPEGDTSFDPFGSGDQQICISRSAIYEGTGTSSDNPREHVNSLTAWVDGSNVYGSDETRANWLRTFQDGKLKMSAGDLLPWNTIDGEFESPIDHTAPEMADDTRRNEKLMVAGDLRADENLVLSSIHTMFAREHNRLCDELKTNDPSLSDEQLYQYARKMVGGIIQNIAFNEWLPATGITLDPYSGYNPNVNPSITNVFSTSAFRLGHTLVNSLVFRMELDNSVSPGGHILMRNAFFNPRQLMADGICIYIKGATCQKMQMFDRMLVSDLRNFLFGSPGSGGLDLATVNIMRARERGVPNLNAIRANLGLPTYTSFEELNSEISTYSKFASMYSSVDEIDSWVGIISEESVEGSIFGETTIEILRRQFTALRDGDRFYFQIDPMLSLAHKREILQTKFHDIIKRNSCLSDVKEDVFFANEITSNGAEVVIGETMNIYPNPVTSHFTMTFNSGHSGKAIFEISDILGKVVLSKDLMISNGRNVISTRLTGLNMPAGVYYPKLRINSQSITGKLIKVN